MTNIYLKNTTIVNQNEWREYLSGEDQEFEANIRTKTRKGLVVGNLEFMKKIEQKTGRALRSLKTGKRPQSTVK